MEPQRTELVKYDSDSGSVELTPAVIKKHLSSNPDITDTEVFMFMQLCRAQKLNPFTREVYLIKYGKERASMVVGKDLFTKRATLNPQCAGFNSGIVVKDRAGELVYRKGTMALADDLVVGGWANVWRHDWSQPLEKTVSMKEYNKGISNWTKIPATMIAKVALVQALREAFPSDLGGLYDADEIDPNGSAGLPTETVNGTGQALPDAKAQNKPAATTTDGDDKVVIVDYGKNAAGKPVATKPAPAKAGTPVSPTKPPVPKEIIELHEKCKKIIMGKFVSEGDVKSDIRLYGNGKKVFLDLNFSEATDVYTKVIKDGVANGHDEAMLRAL